MRSDGDFPKKDINVDQFLANRHLRYASLGEQALPGYNRIVHIGVSNFHRTHQAVYFAEMQGSCEQFIWSMEGAAVLQEDEGLIEALQRQNGAYSITTSSPNGNRSVAVVRPHASLKCYNANPGALIELMTDPGTKIVSLTVTEGGYYLTGNRKTLDVSHPAIATDLANPQAFTTYVSMVVEALHRRFSVGAPPFTVMSCDNLEGNGDTCREVIVAFAKERDPELAAWILSEGAFPNSMVDRITPAAPSTQTQWLKQETGLVDTNPLIAESYRRWIIEDSFVADRPDWESVGVELVTDVKPFEEMKLRILNASHQTMAYVSHFRGFEFVHEALKDPHVRVFLETFIGGESIPTLTHFPQEEYQAYFDEVLCRFANPDLSDRIDRLCWPDETMVSTFILPILELSINAGRGCSVGLALLASWAEYAMITASVQGDPLECAATIERLEQRLESMGAKVSMFREWRNILREQGISAFLALAVDSDQEDRF